MTGQPDLRIMVDLDGVCYDWDSTARFLLNHHFGYVFGPETLSWYFLRDAVAPEHWAWLWSEGVSLGLFRHGHLYRGTAEALDNLAGLGRLVVVTHRPESATRDTLAWIAYHELPVSEIHLLTSETPKSRVQPWCDVCVDDSPTVVEDLAAHTPSLVLVWDRPWNQGVTSGERVYSWLDVIRRVRKLKIVKRGRVAWRTTRVNRTS